MSRTFMKKLIATTIDNVKVKLCNWENTYGKAADRGGWIM